MDRRQRSVLLVGSAASSLQREAPRLWSFEGRARQDSNLRPSDL
jgi:hypothetical protein